MVTDYDCWHTGHDAVTVEAVIAVMHANVTKARWIVRELASRLPDAKKSPSASALATAIITPPQHIDANARKALAPIIGRYYPEQK
jgi:5'-methylthioadenosine phosphorylase